MNNLQLMRILWPSFIVAGMAEAVFFTAFDPHELVVLGEPVTLTRIAVYSIGFFAFWSLTATASALTCMLQKSAAQVNQSPQESPERRAGRPKRKHDAGG